MTFIDLPSLACGRYEGFFPKTLICNTVCPFGCNSLDDQPHLFQCEFLNEDAQVYNYNDIFSNVPTKFMKITEVALIILCKREKSLTK